MTLFEDRERAFEKKFIHDQESRFRALALRNKMLGRWAAERLGLSGEAADAYIQDLRDKVATAAGDEVVAKKLQQDFAEAGIDVSEHLIRHRMNVLLHDAIEQVRASGT